MGFWILGAVLATIFLVILGLNLSTGEKKIERRISTIYSVADAPFRRSMGFMIGPAIVGGNEVRELVNGDQIFPSMLEAIRSARRTITFETFIYWSGTIGSEFAKALAERAKSGVKVHVLLDWVGAGKMDEESLEQLRAAGAQVMKYHPLRWYNLGRLNNRTHRKLLVVDGRVAFTGGVGIADKWLGNAEDPDHWRDSHYRFEGPAVAQAQAAFLDNWIKTSGEVLHGDDYFPPIDTEAGTMQAQMFRSSSLEGSESARLMFLLSIACAARTLRISASYFVPDDLTRSMLVDACRRGVATDVIVPGRHIDTETTRKASRARWGPLLEAGARIHEYQPTMYHTKTMIVDDCWTSVGSTNFDNRSFRLNDEANLNVLDEKFAQRQIAIFEEDLKRSRQITLEDWRNRPLKEKVMERAAALLRSQL